MHLVFVLFSDQKSLEEKIERLQEYRTHGLKTFRGNFVN